MITELPKNLFVIKISGICLIDVLFFRNLSAPQWTENISKEVEHWKKQVLI